jgi:hypothetical protein
MKTTRLTNKVYVVTGKWSTYVQTPFGKIPADNHEDGIAIAQQYLARR